MADRVGQQLGNYHLLRVLGRGGFAEVYLGEHLYLERPAAIKVLHVQMEPEAQEQFRIEARTIAHLQHPHIVSVFDFGIADQTPYLAMEYTPGGTLREQHPKGTQFSLEQIVTYAKQIASALDYAHQQRVIHRDVKPANLLLNARGEVVLSDFGLAVVQQTLESLSSQGPAGTPLYMAPEQIRHHPCPASDQYALGIMVYQWLCGEPPFSGQLYAVLGQHLSEPPPSLCERLPDLPSAVEEAVFRALAKEPGQRFATVQDFALALEEACSTTQPLSLRVPPHQRIQDRDTPALSSVLVTEQQTGGEEYVLPPRPTPHQQTVSTTGKPTLAQSNRQRFLRRVRAFWIDGVLEHSLHGAALIALGLQEQRDALANPWHLVFHHPDTAPRPFPVGTSITEVYDAANGELLILGAPGAGKTTLLLELARNLLDRAQQDEEQPMPVVFPLSSWESRQQPLAEWMIKELISKYQIPRQVARTWVETDQILPLLDGLDEVEAANRTRCIEAVNTYHQEHTFLPLVVSSRSADYQAQTARVKLTSAITIQPLTQEQVDEHLAQAGESLRALRVAFQQDAALHELAETPLMLGILTLTYHGMPVEELLRGGIAPTRQQVFERYTEHMLSRLSTAPSYSPQHTKGWLVWLARQMKRQNRTIFYLEQIQPDWLSSNRMLGVYDWLAVRLPGVLMGVLVILIISVFFFGSFNLLFPIPDILLGGLLGGLLSEGSTPQRPAVSGRRARSALGPRLFQWLSIGALIGLGSGLSIGHGFGLVRPGLLFGLSLGICSILLQFLLRKNSSTEARSQTPSPAKETIWQHLIRRREIHNGLLVGLSVGLSYWLIDGLSTGLSTGLIGGLSAWGLSILLIGRSTAVQPTDLLVWSWRSLGKSLFSKSHVSTTMRVTALIGLLFGLSYWLIWGPRTRGFGELLFELSYWLLLGLSQGVSGATIEDQQRVVPNQGIRRSALNGLLLGLISTVIVGLFGGLDSGLFFGLSYVLAAGLLTGLSAGLLVGLLNGGLASFRHYVLRFLLWRTGTVPWHYVQFLDYAAEHILLRKVGGGYIFVHRLLLEYFASLDTKATPDGARKLTMYSRASVSAAAEEASSPGSS